MIGDPSNLNGSHLMAMAVIQASYNPTTQTNNESTSAIVENINGTTICLPVEDKITSIPSSIRFAFTVVYGVSMVVEFPINVLVIYLIYATRQHRNQSTRLIMYGSLVDSIGSLAFNLVYGTYMIAYDRFTCTTLLVLNTVASFMNIGSAGIAVFISLDRYMRIKYLNDYSIHFTGKRHYMFLALICVEIFVQVCKLRVFSIF